jgi:hypothetical protein
MPLNDAPCPLFTSHGASITSMSAGAGACRVQVVKCVRWQSAGRLFADCGNDRTICVLDPREPVRQD